MMTLIHQTVCSQTCLHSTEHSPMGMLLTADTREQVVAERDYDRRAGTLIAEHIDTYLAWVEYRTNAGNVVHLEWQS